MIDKLKLVIDELDKFDFLDDESLGYNVNKDHTISLDLYLEVHYWLERIAMKNDKLSNDDMYNGEDCYVCFEYDNRKFIWRYMCWGQELRQLLVPSDETPFQENNKIGIENFSAKKK